MEKMKVYYQNKNGVKVVRVQEAIKIDGVDYEENFGEDLPGKPENHKYQTAKIDGVEKRLYPSGKDHPERKYVKFRKFEPITQDDNFSNHESLKFIAYKQFKTRYNPNDPKTFEHKGLLYPLFVGDTGDTKDGIRVGKWYSCGVGELKIPVTVEGIPIEGAPIQVGSKLGNLAYRPGWHLASLPLTRHIGKGKHEYKTVDAKGKEKSSYDYDYTCSQYVWCKVEYSAHLDYTEKAKQRAGADTDPKKAYFTNKKDLENGFYHFKTNSNADDDEDWLIADKIKVLEVLTDKEVKEIVGEKAQARWIADGSDNCHFMADFSQFGKMNESKRSGEMETFEKLRESKDIDYYFAVYSCNENGDELDHLKNFDKNEKDKAIEFCDKQKCAHVVIMPPSDFDEGNSDDLSDWMYNVPYDPFEVIYENKKTKSYIRKSNGKITEESASSIGRFYYKYDDLDYALDEAERTFPEGGYVVIALPTEQFIIVDFEMGANTIKRAKETEGCKIVKEVPSHPTNEAKFTLEQLARVCASGTTIEVSLSGIRCGKIKAVGNKVDASDLWVSKRNLSDDENGQSALDYYNNFPITLIEPVSQNTLKVWL